MDVLVSSNSCFYSLLSYGKSPHSMTAMSILVMICVWV